MSDTNFGFPPGMYPDPENPVQSRYWDGTAWGFIDKPNTYWGGPPATLILADPDWSVARVRYLNGLDIGVIPSILQTYRNSFLVHGRTSRRHVWIFFTFMILVKSLPSLPATLIPDASAWTQIISAMGNLIFYGSVPTLFFLLYRRIHDTNRGGMWLLVSCIPIVGNFLVIYWLGIQRGTLGRNRFTIEPNGKSKDDPVLAQHLRRHEISGRDHSDPENSTGSIYASATPWFNNVFSGKYTSSVRLSGSEISALQSEMFPGDKVRMILPGNSDSKPAYFVISELAIYFLESPDGNPTVTTVFFSENLSWASRLLPETGRVSMEITWGSNTRSITGTFGKRELDQWERTLKGRDYTIQSVDYLLTRVREKITDVHEVFEATSSLFYEQGLAAGRGENEFWDDLEQAYLYIICEDGPSLFQSIIKSCTAPEIISPDRSEAISNELSKSGSSGDSEILIAQMRATTDDKGSRRLYKTTDITARRAFVGEDDFNNVNKRLLVILTEILTMFVEAHSQGPEDTRLSKIQVMRQTERALEYVEIAQNPSFDLPLDDGTRGVYEQASESSVTQTAIAQGWYPNPSNTQQKRYWDGTQWTDQVAPL